MKNIDCTSELLFEPAGLSCQADNNQSLLKIARDWAISLRSECGGKGTCGKCKIWVYPPDKMSPPSDNEKNLLSPQELAQGARLACQARPHGTATIRVPEDSMEHPQNYAKETISGSFMLQPAVKRFFIDGLSPSEKQTGDILGLLAGKCNVDSFCGDVHALRLLSQPEIHGKDLTLVAHRTRGITSVLAGHRRCSLGVGLDIGTTTLAAYLCDFNSGKILSAAASANPQRGFGEDVITRIAYADHNPAGASTLHRLIIEELDRLIGNCLQKAGAQSQDVDEVTVAGNPTMQQLFVAYHPHSLGHAPYLPFSLFPGYMRAEEVGLNLPRSTSVFIFPMVSGFIGGDTLAVILADRPHERYETSLIVDIGTNGEIVLGNRKGMWATSCATGPAFEGAQIACGMRAAAGAVHQVRIDRHDLSAQWEVLGKPGQKPMGICGSGIVDALAEMRRVGLLQPSGRFKEGLPGIVSDNKGIGRKFILVPGTKSATGNDISITLADVRQIQLAKAALYSGIILLMQKAGITRIDRVVLTGAFGTSFNWRNAVAIGMLPNIHADVIITENAAGIGAVSALLDYRLRESAHYLAKNLHTLELASDPEFHKVFPSAMTFPEL